MYVEFDKRMVFLVGAVIISVYDRQSRSRIAVFGDSETYVDIVGPSCLRCLLNSTNDWMALHHDVRGGHLLATPAAYRGNLFWTPRYGDALKGSVKGAVLVTGGRSLTYLSVENGRAAFVLSVRLFSLPPFYECKRI
jgi:hypothetical protein